MDTWNYILGFILKGFFAADGSNTPQVVFWLALLVVGRSFIPLPSVTIPVVVYSYIGEGIKIRHDAKEEEEGGPPPDSKTPPILMVH